MKKITSLLLAILLLLQSSLAFSASTNAVGYFVEKAEFISDTSIEATITYTSNYGSTLDFHTISYLAVYNKETGRLIEVVSQNVDLIKPFQNTGRVTLKQSINVSKTVASVFSVKAIMIESNNSLRPTCAASYYANEIVITPANSRIPLITADAIIPEMSLDRTKTDVYIEYLSIDDASINNGWYFGSPVSPLQTKMLSPIVLKGDVDIKDYIGYLCVIEIDITDKLSPKIHSITKKDNKNTEVLIHPSLFLDTNITSYGYATYYETSYDYKTSKLQLENLTIYNNLVKTSDTQLTANSTDVSYKFVDTDVNGKYDTIFITNEKSFVIGAINTSTKKIFRDTMNSNAMSTYNDPSIFLDPLDDTINWSLKDANDNNLTLDDLKTGQVANVKISEDDSYYTFYDIIITDVKIEGTITEVYSETKKVGYGNTTYYKIGDKFYETVQAVNLIPGDVIIATLNNQDKIISYEMDTSMLKYGVVTGVDVTTSFGTIAQVQLMKQAGEIVTLDIANTVMVNGVYKTSSFDFNTIDKLKVVLPQGLLFIYELNSANEIKTIYTNTAGLAYKNYQMEFVSISGVYGETVEKIGSKYLTDSSLIYAVKTSVLTDKNDLILADKTILFDGETYNGKAIAINSEIKAVVLFDTYYKVKPDSNPFVVTYRSIIDINGEDRTILGGFINGIEREYLGELDLYLDDIQVNDVIQIALNPRNEIAIYTKLADYTSTAFTVLDNGNLGGTAEEYNTYPIQGKNVSLNLATPVAPATIAPNAVYTVGGLTAPIDGFSASGRAYELKGNTLRLINKTYDNVCAVNGSKDYNDGVIIDGDISDYPIDYSTVAYVYNGITKKITVGTIADLETDKVTNDYATTGRENDDLVYVYKYDGTTYMILIVDTVGDSDMSLFTPTYLADGDYAFSVGSVNVIANKLQRNLESPNAQTTLTSAMVYLNPMITTIKNESGANITINDIDPLDVINLTVTTVNGNKKYDVIVNKKVVTGLVSEQIDNIYKIDNIEYTMLNNTPSLQVGESYTIYLDKNNRIVDFIFALVTVRNYGVVTGVDVTQVFGNIAQIQFMTENSEILTLDLAKNINVNGTNITSSILTSNYGSLMNGTTLIISRGTVFIYELNSVSEIKAIYTTTAGIQTKDSAMRFVPVSDIYNATVAKLGSNDVLDSSLIYAVRTTELYDKQDLILASKSLFIDGDIYNGTAIVKDNEIQAVVLFNAGYTVKADSYPLVVTAVVTTSVEGENRTKLRGFVNGEVVEYVAEYDFDVSAISVNDGIQFLLNASNEISNYTKLVDYTNTAFIVGDNGNLGGIAHDDTKIASAGKYVSLNLSSYSIPSPSDVYTIGYNTDPFKGFAACGRAYEVKGMMLGLINKTYDYVCAIDGTKNYNDNFMIDGDISDFEINPNAVAYKYNGVTKKITPTTIADLETDKSTNDCYTTSRDNDDLIYVYNYDGDTYMILIIDTEGDN